MADDSILQLRKLSTPKMFPKDDYICYEGQPGDEMYIILKGSVGVFITNAIGTLNQVATIPTGDFFGEMAIFDKLPRSASCIALEDTLAVAITEDNLQEFLAVCPKIAKQMMESMSGRIRKLNAELYQNNKVVANRHVPKFEIPSSYKTGHVVKAPYNDPAFVMEYRQACPVCGKAVVVRTLKRNALQERGFDTDCRVTYAGCEALWYEVISCNACYYSNHYLKFFSLTNQERDIIEPILQKEHAAVMESRLERRSDFDYLVIRYLQAIHLNEHINPGGYALVGGLWRNLYWLSKDVSNTEFAKYCARQAVEKYRLALDEEQIKDTLGKCTTALSLASMLIYCGDYAECQRFVDIALECPDERVRGKATMVNAQLARLQRK